MILSYIVNQIKIANEFISSTHHKKQVTLHSSATSTQQSQPVDVSGYSTMTLSIDANNSNKSIDIVLEGTIDNVRWTRIPVINNNGICQPYICVRNAWVANVDFTGMYFADISNYSSIRSNLNVTSAGSGVMHVKALLSTTLSHKSPSVSCVRSIISDTSINTRDTVYIGRKQSTVEAQTDGSVTYPIWIDNAKKVNICIENNTNKQLTLKSFKFVNSIDKNMTKPDFSIDVDIVIPSGDTINVSSIDYPDLIYFGGIMMQLNQNGRLVGDATTGTYNLNVYKYE